MPFNGNFVEATRDKDTDGKDILVVQGTSNEEDVARVQEIRLAMLKPEELAPARATSESANGLRVLTVPNGETSKQWTLEIHEDGEPLP